MTIICTLAAQCLNKAPAVFLLDIANCALSKPQEVQPLLFSAWL